MVKKITNPLTGRKVNYNGVLGKKIRSLQKGGKKSKKKSKKKSSKKKQSIRKRFSGVRGGTGFGVFRRKSSSNPILSQKSTYKKKKRYIEPLHNKNTIGQKKMKKEPVEPFYFTTEYESTDLAVLKQNDITSKFLKLYPYYTNKLKQIKENKTNVYIYVRGDLKKSRIEEMDDKWVILQDLIMGKIEPETPFASANSTPFVPMYRVFIDADINGEALIKRSEELDISKKELGSI